MCRTTAGSRIENVPGARVELTIEGQPPRSVLSDHFGDFKIDGLQAGDTKYSLRIDHPQFGQALLTGVLRTSVNLGPISLSAPQSQEASHVRAQ